MRWCGGPRLSLSRPWSPRRGCRSACHCCAIRSVPCAWKRSRASSRSHGISIPPSNSRGSNRALPNTARPRPSMPTAPKPTSISARSTPPREPRGGRSRISHSHAAAAGVHPRLHQSRRPVSPAKPRGPGGADVACGSEGRPRRMAMPTMRLVCRWCVNNGCARPCRHWHRQRNCGLTCHAMLMFMA